MPLAERRPRFCNLATGLSVPVCGTDHKHHAPPQETGSTPAGLFRPLLIHSFCTDPAQGTVCARDDAQPGSGADTHVAEGSPAAVVSPERTGPRPLPCLVVATEFPITAGVSLCVRQVGQLCEQTPHYLGTQAVWWAEVGRAGPSSPE